MQKYKSVQWILEQLKNKEDLDTFELFMGKEVYKLIMCKTIQVPAFDKNYGIEVFNGLYSFEQEKTIRTALSRIEGKAVLSALDKINPKSLLDLDKKGDGILKPANYIRGIKLPKDKTVSEFLYEIFDNQLRNGESLDQALTALDIVMELIKII